jgi:toxin ParE1/3/4
MREAAFTPAAMHDMADILDFIGQDNEAKALEVLGVLFRQANLLVQSPWVGRSRDDDLGPGIRSFPVGNYLLFYRVQARGVEVLRVLHSARDLPRLFED